MIQRCWVSEIGSLDHRIVLEPRVREVSDQRIGLSPSDIEVLSQEDRVIGH